jgi:uncharacterized protein
MVDCDDGHTLVLIAKCPAPGTSKTRLIPSFGEHATFELAKAMLLDVLHNLGSSPLLEAVRKVFVYAPATARQQAQALLHEAGAEELWELQPVASSVSLTAIDLTSVLRAALQDVRLASTTGTAVFIGMDTPDLQPSCVLDAIAKGKQGQAYICPANDGGYVLLGLPPAAPPEVFDGVKWSCHSTCISQMGVIAGEHTWQLHIAVPAVF